jgi:hypothetical protein
MMVGVGSSSLFFLRFLLTMRYITRIKNPNGTRKMREIRNKLSRIKAPPPMSKNLKGFVVKSIFVVGRWVIVVVDAVSGESTAESVVSDTAVMAVEW